MTTGNMHILQALVVILHPLVVMLHPLNLQLNNIYIHMQKCTYKLTYMSDPGIIYTNCIIYIYIVITGPYKPKWPLDLRSYYYSFC